MPLGLILLLAIMHWQFSMMLLLKLYPSNLILIHQLHFQEPSHMLTVMSAAQEDLTLLKDSLIPMLAIFIRLMSSKLMAADQLSSSMEPATTWIPTRTATPSTLSQETVSPVPTPTTNSLLEPVSSLPPAILDSPW